MARARKVIITCAVTGAIHTPTMSPHLPVTPDEITREALAAVEAGAAVLHLHARDPETGRPDQSPEAFARFLPRIKQASNAVINVTTGGSPFMAVEERVRPAATFKPEVASLNMGSMNFGLFPMLDRYDSFQFDWERQHLEATRDLVFKNTFKDIEYVLATCRGKRHPFRVRVLRHRPSLQLAPLSRPRTGRTAALHPVGLRHPRGHRHPSGGPHAHEAHCRPAVRGALPLVGPRCRPPADRPGFDGRSHGRKCACRSRGLALGGSRQAGGIQCRAGGDDPPGTGGHVARGGDARRGAGDPFTEGRGPGEFLGRGRGRTTIRRNGSRRWLDRRTSLMLRIDRRQPVFAQGFRVRLPGRSGPGRTRAGAGGRRMAQGAEMNRSADLRPRRPVEGGSRHCHLALTRDRGNHQGRDDSWAVDPGRGHTQSTTHGRFVPDSAVPGQIAREGIRRTRGLHGSTQENARERHAAEHRG